MIKVIPLTKFDVDWASLLSVTSQGLGKKITASLDNRGKKIGSISSYIEVLGAMREIYDLDNPGPLLRHIHFSFLVISDYQYCNDDLLLSAYTVQANNGLFITVLSGTLDEWRSAIINGCSEVADYKTQQILSECLLQFDTLGLTKLWSNYRRTKAPLRLIEK